MDGRWTADGRQMDAYRTAICNPKLFPSFFSFFSFFIFFIFFISHE